MDFLLDLIEYNEHVQYDNVSIIVGIYVLLLWGIVSLWAAIDAHRRYESKIIASIWFVVILLLNLPALVLYMTIRPDQSHEMPSSGHDLILPLWKLDKGEKLVLSMEILNDDYQVKEQKLEIIAPRILEDQPIATTVEAELPISPIQMQRDESLMLAQQMN